MREHFTGLWRHPDFLKLWTGQTISQFGSQATEFALPLIAALTLQASPAQMGLLTATETLPFLLAGLVAGVWVDRLRRRRILIAADIGRAVLLGLVPLLALTGQLRMAHLYVIGFLIGVLRVFFDVAYQSFLPTLVRPEHLVEGNSKLEASSSVATIAGPGLAGLLVQLLTAPVALAIDACSFGVSALSLGFIRTPEAVPPHGERRRFWTEAGEGLRVVLGSPTLRAIAGCTGTWNLCGNIWYAAFVLYAIRQLGVSPAVLGATYTLGSTGALLGALLANRAGRAVGPGPAIIGAALLGTRSALLVPIVSGPGLMAAAMIATVRFVSGLGNTTYRISQVSLRQAIVPANVQGRMNATMRFLSMSVIPVGALLGGSLGEVVGLRPTLVVGALGLLAAPLWLLLSPLRTLSQFPLPPGESVTATGRST